MKYYFKYLRLLYENIKLQYEYDDLKTRYQKLLLERSL